MNDNYDDLDPELKTLVDGVIDVLDSMDKIDSPVMMMQILASCAATVLCSKIGSEEEAKNAYDIFHKVISATIDKAKSDNMTMWVKGTPH